MADTAHPAPATDQERDTSTRVPPWISVFILFGALGGLIALFALACWFAKSLARRSPASQQSESTLERARAGEDESIVHKMRQLDENAPAKPYKAWKADGDTASLQANGKAAALATSVPVCAICLDTLDGEDLIRQLPCNHAYHSACIVKWYLKKHDTCPLCKTYYVPHAEGDITEPARALSRGRVTARDDALLRFYQTMST